MYVCVLSNIVMLENIVRFSPLKDMFGSLVLTSCAFISAINIYVYQL